MKTYKRSENQQRILEGMARVHEKLIEFKKKMNSKLVVLKDGKIIHLDP